ncbi:hypothetical protein ACFQ0M_46430 [Kitasatospora aburaviensis]
MAVVDGRVAGYEVVADRARLAALELTLLPEGGLQGRGADGQA